MPNARSRGDTATTLRGLAALDLPLLESLVGAHMENAEESGLPHREYALIKIAALVALGAPRASYAWQVAFARESGVDDDDLIGVLIGLAPTVGMAKTISGASEIAYALGFDLEE